MSIGLGIGLAAIAFCQVALLMGLSYYLVGKWVEGRPRTYVAAIVASAYLVGRIQQSAEDAGWNVLADPKIQVVVATYVLTLVLFALRTNTKSNRA